MSSSKNIKYEIKCNASYSWSYLYFFNGKKRELWSGGVGGLKKKVLERGLPWDDDKVPETKPSPSTNYHNRNYDPYKGPRSYIRIRY